MIALEIWWVALIAVTHILCIYVDVVKNCSIIVWQIFELFFFSLIVVHHATIFVATTIKNAFKNLKQKSFYNKNDPSE